MITDEAYLAYVDQALEAMCELAGELGDELVCRRLDLPGANSVYGLTVHCLGVADYWAGGLVGGRRIERDRDAEFRATGTVEDLRARVREGRAQLGLDIAAADHAAPPRGDLSPDDLDLPPAVVTQGVVLVHVLEELYQHLGQMELIRDGLLALTRSAPPSRESGRLEEA